MGSPNVGLNITCNSNCSSWCPRVLRIFCCCCCKVDNDDKERVEKTDKIAHDALETKKGAKK